MRYDPAGKPGVSNLLSILGAVTDRSPEDVAETYSQYGPLKVDTAEAVVELLRPIQERFHELADDPAGTGELLAIGAEKAQVVASDVYARAVEHIGLLPRA